MWLLNEPSMCDIGTFSPSFISSGSVDFANVLCYFKVWSFLRSLLMLSYIPSLLTDVIGD